MPYDIASIAREVQDEFGLFTRGAPPQQNSATAGHLREFVDALDTFTEALLRARLEGASLLGADIGQQQWDADFTAWDKRLATYADALEGVPDDDRKAVLWSVTAPLLLGFYGGALSKISRKPLDAVTPFILANMLDVSEQWRDERWSALLDDVTPSIPTLPGAASLSFVATLAAFGAAVLLFIRRRRA